MYGIPLDKLFLVIHFFILLINQSDKLKLHYS